MYGLFIIISSGLKLVYSFDNPLERGQLVFVPLKQGKVDKKVISIFYDTCSKPEFECRHILYEAPSELSLKPSQFNLIHGVATYYLTPVEWCVRLLAPGVFWNTDKFNTVLKYYKKLMQNGDDDELTKNVQNTQTILKESSLNVLNIHQNRALDEILQNLDKTILFHGVTGSGKTEVYLAVAEQILKKGKNCLILVPEISLTPQIFSRFHHIFGDKLSILHSGISPIVLLKEWLSICLGKKRIVLGVRSAVFCPLNDIGLIIVDEEHEQSYKSSEKPCYHARDVAVMRAKLENACCLLGSATPSLESYFNVQMNKYKYVELKFKFAHTSTVETRIIEPKKGSSKFKLVQPGSKEPYIEKSILELIRKNHEQNFQSIVLLNRRGFVHYALCEFCRVPLSCPNCSVATTIHNFGKREICHYCDFNKDIRKQCPHCKSSKFLLKGVGTQNIESFLKEKIQSLVVERLDRDSLTSHSKLVKIINKFRNLETHCLVGTQILAKGHDFPNVTLCVILNLEDSLYLPDFRAAEKTFHLLTQAIGRVGRGKHNGMVILQSMVKTHPVIDLALQQDVSAFLKKEIIKRERAHLPPYIRLILLELKNKNKILIEKYAQIIKNKCINYWKELNLNPSQVFLSGPYDAPIERINNIFRIHLCVHVSKKIRPNIVIPESIYTSLELKRVLKIDVDPQNFI